MDHPKHLSEGMTELDLPFPKYRCPVCEQDLPLGDAHLTVTCKEHRPSEELAFVVREATAQDAKAVALISERALGETEIDAFGTTFDVMDGVNLIADADNSLAGLLSLGYNRGDLVVVLLSVYPEYQGSGIGAALLRAALEYARERRIDLLRVAVSNDDIPLLYFYQRHGFAIYDVAVGRLVDEARGVVTGFSGIPSRDEIYLRRVVGADEV